jgi:hypothetical protein
MRAEDGATETALPYSEAVDRHMEKREDDADDRAWPARSLRIFIDYATRLVLGRRYRSEPGWGGKVDDGGCGGDARLHGKERRWKILLALSTVQWIGEVAVGDRFGEGRIVGRRVGVRTRCSASSG